MNSANSPNTKIRHKGKDYWISRSVAVVGLVFMYVIDEGTTYIPLVKRGKSSIKEHGKWSLPCWYLDWGETCFDALKRELNEECGLDLKKYLNLQIHKKESLWKPYNIYDTPSDSQDINLQYFFNFQTNTLPKLLSKDTSEISIARRFPVKEAIKMNLAFWFEETIKERYDFIKITSSRNINLKNQRNGKKIYGFKRTTYS